MLCAVVAAAQRRSRVSITSTSSGKTCILAAKRVTVAHVMLKRAATLKPHKPDTASDQEPTGESTFLG